MEIARGDIIRALQEEKEDSDFASCNSVDGGRKW